MIKRKLILFSQELPNCPSYARIFNTEYEISTSETEDEFFTKIYSNPADAAIICFCSAREEEIENLERLDALTGPLPILTCSKRLNPNFIRKAAQRGATHFLSCDMERGKIREIIHNAIRDDGLREYLESAWPDCLTSSLYIRKLIDEIVHVFPHRMTVKEYAERLGIDRGWLHKLCKKTFKISPTSLLRRIWVHQALRIMQHTNLDNTDIALQLHYSEESSMAREFRKELNCNPNKARKYLINSTPEELLT